MTAASRALTPVEAARAANDVYDIKDSSVARTTIDTNDVTGMGGIPGSGFSLSGNDRVMGVTGLPALGNAITARTGSAELGNMVSAKTGMAFVAHRPAKEESLIAVRGTASLFDLATDLDGIARTVGPGGHRLHHGFLVAAKAIREDVDRIIARQNSRVLHFTGHSLGGAIAVILAAHFASQRKFDEVYCYTFGAPRVGDALFGDWFTGLLGEQRVWRLYHPCDPVPMVGPYPFQQPDFNACKAPSPNESGIRVNYHSMTDVYLNVARGKQWSDFSNDIPNLLSSDNIRWWLDSGFASQPIGFMSGRIAGLVLDALRFILEKLNAGLNLVLTTKLTRHATMVDTLAAALVAGYNLGGTMAGWVKTIINTVARLVGRTAIKAADTSAWFIRYVFDLFFRELASLTRRAIQQTLR